MKNSVLKKIYTLFFSLFFYCLAFADPGTEDSSGSGNLDSNDPVPINDYLWALGIIGLLYIFHKLKKHHQKKAATV